MGGPELDVPQQCRLFQGTVPRGRIDVAERPLAIREESSRPDQVQISYILRNLGSVLYTEGRYAEAEKVIQRAIAIQEKALGPEHLHLATILNSLALVYDSQCDTPMPSGCSCVV